MPTLTYNFRLIASKIMKNQLVLTIQLPQKKPQLLGAFFYNHDLSLFTQIHFSSGVQFVELIVFKIVNKQDTFSC
jgi:hypothetical protein